MMLDNYRKYETTALWMPNFDIANHEKHLNLREDILNNKRIYFREDFSEWIEDNKSGQGTILSFERRFTGWKGVSDSSHITKLILFYNKKLLDNGGLKINRNTSDVIALIIDGSPSFGDYCIGYAREGSIKYRIHEKSSNHNPSDEVFFKTFKVDQALMAVIYLKVELIANGGLSQSNCGSCIFSADLMFTKR